MLWEGVRLTLSRRCVRKQERKSDMTGSMYAAVSGLKAHMSALNVIGNNVSNVNTYGYKTTRYTFNEALYTTQISGSNGTETIGGRNPAQVGFGASVGTIDLDMSTKNYTPTANQLDTMIDGDGFFIVGDKVVGAEDSSSIGLEDTTVLQGMNLSRLGNFNIDPNGFLVDGNGSVVWGFLTTQAADAYYLSGENAGQSATLTGEGNSATPPNGAKRLTDMTAAEFKELNTVRKKAGLPELINPEYRYKQYKEGETPPVGVTKDTEGFELDKNGNRQQFIKNASVASSSALSALRMPLIKTVTKTTTAAGQNGAETSTSTTTITTAWPDGSLKDAGVIGTAPPVTEEGTTTTTTYARLEPDNVTIDGKTGAVRVMDSDGNLFTVGYIAIAKVTNPNGVTHVDGRYYQALDGAGEIRVTSVGGVVAGTETSGDTSLLTGGLESSGTDLATEITNMITIQRGYQANTRIVTVTDSMLEELVNMKR